MDEASPNEDQQLFDRILREFPFIFKEFIILEISKSDPRLSQRVRYEMAVEGLRAEGHLEASLVPRADSEAMEVPKEESPAIKNEQSPPPLESLPPPPPPLCPLPTFEDHVRRAVILKLIADTLPEFSDASIKQLADDWQSKSYSEVLNAAILARSVLNFPHIENGHVQKVLEWEENNRTGGVKRRLENIDEEGPKAKLDLSHGSKDKLDLSDNSLLAHYDVVDGAEDEWEDPNGFMVEPGPRCSTPLHPDVVPPEASVAAQLKVGQFLESDVLSEEEDLVDWAKTKRDHELPSNSQLVRIVYPKRVRIGQALLPRVMCREEEFVAILSQYYRPAGTEAAPSSWTPESPPEETLPNQVNEVAPGSTTPLSPQNGPNESPIYKLKKLLMVNDQARPKPEEGSCSAKGKMSDRSKTSFYTGGPYMYKQKQHPEPCSDFLAPLSEEEKAKDSVAVNDAFLHQWSKKQHSLAPPCALKMKSARRAKMESNKLMESAQMSFADDFGLALDPEQWKNFFAPLTAEEKERARAADKESEKVAVSSEDPMKENVGGAGNEESGKKVVSFKIPLPSKESEDKAAAPTEQGTQLPGGRSEGSLRALLTRETQFPNKSLLPRAWNLEKLADVGQPPTAKRGPTFENELDRMLANVKPVMTAREMLARVENTKPENVANDSESPSSPGEESVKGNFGVGEILDEMYRVERQICKYKELCGGERVQVRESWMDETVPPVERGPGANPMASSSTLTSGSSYDDPIDKGRTTEEEEMAWDSVANASYSGPSREAETRWESILINRYTGSSSEEEDDADGWGRKAAEDSEENFRDRSPLE